MGAEKSTPLSHFNLLGAPPILTKENSFTNRIKLSATNPKLPMQPQENTVPTGIQWINKAEIAHHFRCSIRHVNKLMNRRILPFVKIGRFVRFDLAACDHAMKNYQTKSLFA